MATVVSLYPQFKVFMDLYIGPPQPVLQWDFRRHKLVVTRPGLTGGQII